MQTPQQPNPKERLQLIYGKVFERMGLRPEIDAEGDFRFSFEGNTQCLQIMEDDSEYLRILMPDLSTYVDDNLINAATATNMECPFSKVFLVQRDFGPSLWVSAEILVADFEIASLEILLGTACQAAAKAFNTLVEHMKS